MCGTTWTIWIVLASSTWLLAPRFLHGRIFTTPSGPAATRLALASPFDLGCLLLSSDWCPRIPVLSSYFQLVPSGYGDVQRWSLIIAFQLTWTSCSLPT